MDAAVDVVLRKKLPNEKWTLKRYKNIKLEVEKDLIKRSVWMLVIGRSSQKEKIQVSQFFLYIGG